jgi:hypothetical protein
MSDVPKVYSAIAAVMAALSAEGISKDKRNAQQGYNFRGIDDVYNALSPVLSRNKLVMLPRILSRTVVERQTQKGGVLFYVTVEAEFDLISAEDGSKHTIRTFGEAMDSADKATNKAMSAAYKYAAMQAFAIPTEGDNDADAQTHEVAPVRGSVDASKADSRDDYARLSKANREIATRDDFDKFWRARNVIAALEALPRDWRQKMHDEKTDKAAELAERAAMQGDDFPGDTPLRGTVPPTFDHLETRP